MEERVDGTVSHVGGGEHQIHAQRAPTAGLRRRPCQRSTGRRGGKEASGEVTVGLAAGDLHPGMRGVEASHRHASLGEEWGRSGGRARSRARVVSRGVGGRREEWRDAEIDRPSGGDWDGELLMITRVSLFGIYIGPFVGL